MKSLLAIYMLFVRAIVKGFGYYVFLMSASLALLLRFISEDRDPSSALASVAAVSSFVILILGICWLVPQNLVWLMLTSISKRKLIALQGVINFTYTLAVTLSFFVIVTLAELFLIKKVVFVFRFAGKVKKVFEMGPSFIETGFHFHPYEFLSVFLLVCMLSIFFLFGVGGGFKGTGALPQLGKIDFLRTFRFFVFLLFLFFLRDFVLSPFGIFLFFLSLMCLAIPQSWISGVAFAGNSAKVSRWGFIALGVIQASLVYGLATTRVKSNPEERGRALLFLGPFAGSATQDELLSLLSSDLDWETTKNVGKAYLTRFNDETVMDQRLIPKTLFSKMIESKGSKEGVYEAYKLFEPRSLGVEELKTIYSSLQRTKDDGTDWGVFVRFLEANVNQKEMHTFFDSKDSWLNTYALLRARYDQNSFYVGYILDNLSRYSETNVLIALDTLSVLRGTRMTLENWHAFRNGRQLSRVGLTIDCTDYQPKNSSAIVGEDLAKLNACLRRKADKTNVSLLRNIESAGWIDLPLSSSARFLIQEVFPKVRE